MGKKRSTIDITKTEEPIISNTCWSCARTFNLYLFQATPLSFCLPCAKKNSAYNLVKLTSLYETLKKIIQFSETNKVQINKKDALYIDELVKYLQEID